MAAGWPADVAGARARSPPQLPPPPTPQTPPPPPQKTPKQQKNSFEWSDLDTSDPAQIDELYHLLHHNYVEDDSEAFRFRYSPDFLRWALRPPGHRPEWSIGVRASAASTKQGEKPAATPPTEQGEEGKEADAGATSSTNPQNKKQKGKLLGFISAVPATMGVSGKTVAMVEINFLCVHKRLRSKRLAPLLIREVTRRVNLQGIWQAAYTAGVVLPVPLSEARYWHRPLHPRKLVDVGFSHLPPRATMKAYVKLHSLPAPGSTLSGLRPFDPAKDAAGVAALLGAYLETGAEGGGGGGGGSSSSPCRFRMAPVMCEGEVAHWLGPREGVVGTWVVERAVDDPEVLRMLAEEDGGALAAASSSWSPSAAAAAGEAAAPTEEDRRRARSQRAAARRAVAASREVALRQAAAATAEGGGGGGAAAASGGGGKGGGKKPPPKPTFVSDLLSFYTIASSVLSHPSHDELRAAYGFYSVPGTHPPKHLLKEALCLAAASGHDVFNLLELADGADRAALKELKFGPGDGQLRYYLYNWRAKGAPFAPADVGLVLL